MEFSQLESLIVIYTPLPLLSTAFKFRAQRWDFMKVGTAEIADRVQYRRQDGGQWQGMHVST